MVEPKVMPLSSRLLVVVAALVGVAAAALAVIVVGSLPDHDGTRIVAGLDGPVTIRRDDHGVPHIEAESEADGYFALGWVHAQDRPWQLELRRRIGQGRLAELIGADGLETDRFMRLMRFHDLARANLGAMAPADRRLVEAYARGVNAQLERTRLLPPPFWFLWHRPEPWSAADALVWHKLMALDLARDWRHELVRARVARHVDAATFAELFPDVPAPTPTRLEQWRTALAGVDLDGLAELAGAPHPAAHGSNAWAVAPARTRTGGALLANDPHLGHELPGVWYLAGLRTPDIEVVGATLPGLPVFVTGRNANLAWSVTNTGTDVQDLVVEDVSADGGFTRTPEGLAPLDVVTSTIGVRGGDEERFASRWSVHGPLVSDLVSAGADLAGPGRALALQWTALVPDDTTIAAGFALARARDVGDVERALATFTNPQQNIIFATGDGTIGMASPGHVPVRAGGGGALPRLGWREDGAWTGMVPRAELPRRIAPPAGWLANANNPPTPAAAERLPARWDDPFRFERIAAQLVSERHDVADFRALQLDQRSGLADALLPAMLAARAPDVRTRRWLDRLGDWDRHADPDRPEPLVFTAWYTALAEHLYADELGPAFDAYRAPRTEFVHAALTTRRHWCDDVATPARAEDCPEVLGAALAAALDRLESELGPPGAAWAWGRQHPAEFAHETYAALGPLGRIAQASLARGGDDTTVDAASPSNAASPPLFPSRHGVSYRQIVDLASPERSRFVAAGGQVGHPLSRHYRDLLALWHDGKDVAMVSPARARRVERLQPE
jgi:penicillin amidase